MVAFPHAKINLGLRIIAKRNDGFHDIETVFYPIDMHDVLEIATGNDSSPDISFATSGLTINGEVSSNLCVKAFRLLKSDFPQLPSIQMHLLKAIPMGAGLGGGSADGAFALQMINEKYKLELTTQQLNHYALQLGSDCPFFLQKQPCYATGRGEQLQPIQMDLSGYRLLIVCPRIHINTGWAFSQITPTVPSRSLEEIAAQPIHSWKTEMMNDFEEPVFAKYPEIRAIKENLYMQGAVYAAMTGTGSTVFGFFEKAHNIAAIQSRYSDYLTMVV